jgi:hypothetical protein
MVAVCISAAISTPNSSTPLCWHTKIAREVKPAQEYAWCPNQQASYQYLLVGETLKASLPVSHENSKMMTDR